MKHPSMNQISFRCLPKLSKVSNARRLKTERKQGQQTSMPSLLHQVTVILTSSLLHQRPSIGMEIQQGTESSKMLEYDGGGLMRCSIAASFSEMTVLHMQTSPKVQLVTAGGWPRCKSMHLLVELKTTSST